MACKCILFITWILNINTLISCTWDIEHLHRISTLPLIHGIWCWGLLKMYKVVCFILTISTVGLLPSRGQLRRAMCPLQERRVLATMIITRSMVIIFHFSLPLQRAPSSCYRDDNGMDGNNFQSTFVSERSGPYQCQTVENFWHRYRKLLFQKSSCSW